MKRMQRIAVVVFGVLVSAVGVRLPAAALPGTGLGSAVPRPNPPAPRTEDPAILVEQGFERVLGRELNRREENQLKHAIREFQKIQEEQERPQKVNFVTDFFSTNEFLPVFCFHGKVSAKIPSIGSINVGGLGGSVERTPCLLLNSMWPWQWRSREFSSYIMKGLSATSAGSKFGGLSAGVAGGIYIGPKNTTRQFIGTYTFARLMYEVNAGVANGNISLQAAYNQNRQAIIMVGAGGEIGWNAIYNATTKVLPRLPKMEAGAVASIPPWKVEVGMYYDVKEFPWYQRLVNGWDPISAFSDMEQYIAANN